MREQIPVPQGVELEYFPLYNYHQRSDNRPHVTMGSPSAKRNDPCPCGSGKKHKRCHLLKIEAAFIQNRKQQEAEQ